MARVSKTQVESQLKQIVELIKDHPDGIGRRSIAEEYHGRFGQRLATRTLQRRLERLIVRGAVASHGDGPGTVYKKAVEQPESSESEGYPRLSAEATRIRALVRRPISQKDPVGYDREWLLKYTPGRTWYLPKSTRSLLRRLGTTQGDDRPAGTFARDIFGRLLIDLSWASSRLEGNTYSRLDTQNLLEYGQHAEGKDAQETQMILNHKAAIELLVENADRVGFNRHTISGIHTALSENLLTDPADEGRLRERPVNISGTSYTPTAIPQVIRECFDRIMETASHIPDPFEKAFFAMVHIPYLQPFVDVNKRTSRLAANIPLIQDNLCPLSFVDVPETAYVEGTLAVYEQKRIELLRDVFVFAYERSAAQYRVVRESLGQPDPIRLRYRTEIASAVTQSIKAGEEPRLETMRRRGQELGVPAPHVVAFSEAALRVLVNLHEGSAARYGLRASEFSNWKKSVANPAHTHG